MLFITTTIIITAIVSIINITVHDPNEFNELTADIELMDAFKVVVALFCGRFMSIPAFPNRIGNDEYAIKQK